MLCSRHPATTCEEVSDLISLRVDKVGLDPERGQAIVLLKDDDGHRYLPISVGPFEANAIALAVEEVKPPRPLTHDLLRDMLESLEAKITRILIDDLKEGDDGTGTFYAQITIEANGRQVEVDSRPSDAIALAVRTGAPIFALEKVLDAAAVPEEQSDGNQVH